MRQIIEQRIAVTRELPGVVGTPTCFSILLVPCCPEVSERIAERIGFPCFLFLLSLLRFGLPFGIGSLLCSAAFYLVLGLQSLQMGLNLPCICRI